MKKIGILYLHGYGGSKNGRTFNNLKKMIPEEYVLHSIDYEYDADKAITSIRNYVNEHDISIVIGSSLGGFLAMNIPGVYKILYNPCYIPSVELPKIGFNDTSSFMGYENLQPDLEERLLTYAIFTEDDELLGMKYVDTYKKDWNPNNVIIRSGLHKMSIENIKNVIIPLMKNMIDNKPKFVGEPEDAYMYD